MNGQRRSPPRSSVPGKKRSGRKARPSETYLPAWLRSYIEVVGCLTPGDILKITSGTGAHPRRRLDHVGIPDGIDLIGQPNRDPARQARDEHAMMNACV